MSSKSVQHTNASRSSWVWSALLKVTLTVYVKGGDSTSPLFPALWFSSLQRDLSRWLSSFKPYLKTAAAAAAAAAVTLQNAEVGYKPDSDGLIWTAEMKTFTLHNHQCLITSRLQLTTNWKWRQWPIRVMKMIVFRHFMESSSASLKISGVTLMWWTTPYGVALCLSATNTFNLVSQR